MESNQQNQPSNIINYDKAHPYVQLLQFKIKKFSKQLVSDYRVLQILTRRWSNLFVQHFCILLEDQQEPMLSIVREVVLQVKLTENAQIQKMKERARKLLAKSNIFFDRDEVYVCTVRSQDGSILLKVNFKTYLFGKESEDIDVEEYTPLPIMESPSFLVQSQQLIKQAQEAYKQVANSAVKNISTLLYVEQLYFMNIFTQTDKIILAKQFQGVDKWLSKLSMKIDFFEVVSEDGKQLKYLTSPFYSNIGCTQHFKGFGMKGKAILEKELAEGKQKYCQFCKAKMQPLVLDRIMTSHMNSVYNPKHQSIMYYPVGNRFKLIRQVKGSKYQPTFENLYHFRDTVKELGRRLPRKNHFFPLITEQFSLVYALGNQRRIVEEPCRGQNCRHLAFYDIRTLWLTREQVDKFSCPICKQPIDQRQILYIKEAEPILKFVKQKMKEKKANLLSHQNYVKLQIRNSANHNDVRLKMKFYFADPEEIQDIPRIYKTLYDPFYPYDESELELQDEQLEKEIEEYYWPKEIQADM